MRMSAVLCGGAIAEQTMQDFLADARLWRESEAMEDPLAKVQAIKRRHCMQLTANQQILKGLESNGGCLSQDFITLLAKRSAGVISSQICEDMVAAAKNDSTANAVRKFRRSESNFEGLGEAGGRAAS